MRESYQDEVKEEISNIDKAIKGIESKVPTHDINYELQALKAMRRSWKLDDPVCQSLALQDAQVWATLHLANKTRAGIGS